MSLRREHSQKIEEAERFKKHHTDSLRRKVKVGTVVAIGAGLYILHRKKINLLTAKHLEALDAAVGGTFDSGVRYGLQLANDTMKGDVFATIDAANVLEKAPEYAFGAFDKSA